MWHWTFCWLFVFFKHHREAYEMPIWNLVVYENTQEFRVVGFHRCMVRAWAQYYLQLGKLWRIWSVLLHVFGLFVWIFGCQGIYSLAKNRITASYFRNLYRIFKSWARRNSEFMGSICWLKTKIWCVIYAQSQTALDLIASPI